MTGTSLHSPLWHRVERLKPRLRRDIIVERHIVRGDVWYIVRDRFSTHAHRFSPAVYFLLQRMDGERSFEVIWREAVARFGDNAPSQDQILRIASQLYVANILQSDASVDEDDLTRRAKAERDRLLAANLKNPMFLRLPLVDPDAFLAATLHLVRPFCGWVGGIAWLAAVIWLGAEMAMNWRELTSDLADKVLAAQSIVTIIVVYPLLKILHELGHAYATKLAGQEVHEIGVMFLTLLPAPYVDASSSALVASKWQRAIIAAAGMMVELLIAAGAMWVWLEAQPGLTRSIAYDALLVASVSTLLFNGNPLLRFDAYYILSDLIEVPNLASRAQQYYLYLAQRYVFGLVDSTNPAAAAGERTWFIFYAPASFVYRMVTLAGIAIFLSTKYFFVGIALAVWMMVTAIVWPILKAVKFLLLSPVLAGVRLRAVGLTAVFIGLLAASIAGVPIPEGTVVRGLVWLPDEARVVAGVSGHFKGWLVAAGSMVRTGDPLVLLEDPLIGAKRHDAEAKLAEIEARLRSAEAHSPYDTQVLTRQRDLAREELADLDRQEANLLLKSNANGRFIVPHERDMQGNFVKRGQTVGYVIASASPVIRASVPESEIEYVRDRTQGVSIRFDEAIWSSIDGAITRVTPKPTHNLPSPALSSTNGGPFTPDPQGHDKEAMLDSIFEVDVQAPDTFADDRWGQRVWVRFDHGASPVAARLYRSLRQLFLGRFHV